MKAATLRLYQTLHTWVGLMAGWALFIAFFAGAITVFHEELHAWQSPQRTVAGHPAAAGPDPAALDGFMHALVAAHPNAAASAYVTLPTKHEPGLRAYWQDKAGEWQTTTSASLAAGRNTPKDTSLDAAQGELAAFIDSLHYTLGVPVAGNYFMGVVAVLYGLALVSGVLLHLPRLKPDLFAIRPGRNLKRFWMDAHNVIGLFSLPFHLVFAITGAVLCLAMVLVMVFNVMAFDGKLLEALPRLTTASPELKASGQPAQPLPAATLLAAARASAGERFAPLSLRYQHYGDASALIEIRGGSARALGNYGSVSVRAAAGRPDSGKVLANQAAGSRDANHAIYSALYDLHFGTYGGLALRLVYLLAGLAGAFLFYSGNLLWIESRRKTRQQEQPRVHRLLAQATVGVCIGCCIAVAAAFCGALLWPARATGYTYFPVFFAAIGWALLRPPARAAIELLWTATAAALLVPLVNALVTGDYLWRAALAGHWAVAGFDIGALALACGFAALALATQRRARSGPPNSVWAMQKARTGVAETTVADAAAN
ncbi:PepSY-associated TM helix domain-containing protein [Cupriavidus basilensis]|uniref:PepSY-associated TM helix domain-containing protein n=1 Tax=Cupriavidus basilensis TaxID=68895 RepID=A0ABT6B582_9BURK|nr:PepSY-associated TM helix domain-containing protein [Cupriavidus basilensis]MDF3840025.1 PepSY-associated TM helix domain-containing protein [Cupriavidus basilensis]